MWIGTFTKQPKALWIGKFFFGVHFDRKRKIAIKLNSHFQKLIGIEDT